MGHSRTIAVVLVAALALSAGCNGPFGGGDGDSAGDGTLTPAPVPTVAPATPTPTPRPAPGSAGTATDLPAVGPPDWPTGRRVTSRPPAGSTNESRGDLPPGLSATGVTDGFALADAHAAALANTSFTVRVRHTLTAADGTTVAVASEVRRVAAGLGRVLVSRRPDGPVLSFLSPTGRVDRVERWFNGSHSVYRVSTPGGTAHATVDPVRAPDSTDARTLRQYYLNGADEAVATERGAVTVSLVVPLEGRGWGEVPRVTATEATVTVRLTERGRVTRYRVTYDGRLADDPDTRVRGVRDVRFVGVGTTTVERPAWVDAERNGTAGS